jgi:cytidylate kinase
VERTKRTLLEDFARYMQVQSARAEARPKYALPAITISRETGAGGTTIARLLAENLGDKFRHPWTVFDKNLAEVVLKDHNLPAPVERFMHEDAPPVIRDAVEELLGVHPSGWKLVEHTAETILRLADLGRAIFLGRASNIITAKRKSVFHVRLVAPYARRIRNVEDFYHLDPEAAAEFISVTDGARRRYVKHYFKAEIDDPLRYHLVVNTGLIGYDEAARLIGDATMKLQQPSYD